MPSRDRHRLADRIAEAAATLLGAAALALLLAGPREGGPALADARPSPIPPDTQREFLSRLDAARTMVDGNLDADQPLSSLKGDFWGRHEVWALSGRYMESRQRWAPAVLDYAHAVRLEPAYLDEGSPLFLGGRIEGLVERRVDALLKAKSLRPLGMDETAELKAAYFLKRRLAGGCE